MPETTDPISQEQQVQGEQVALETLPESVQKYIKSLRQEAATNRISAKEIATKYEADKKKLDEFAKAEEKRVAEQGDFKKLYEDTKTKLDEFIPYQEKVKSYETHFQKQLDAELEGVDESVKELIASSNKSLPERLELARKMKGQAAAQDSQGSARPGGGLKPDGDYVKRFKEAKTSAERARILTETKSDHPKVYEALMKIA